MKRREFLTCFGVAITAWPWVSAAQSGKIARIGVLTLGNPDPAPFLSEFRAGLRGLGYVEGQNIQLELRSANRDAALLPIRAQELVNLKVDIIVAYHTPAAMAASRATREIPIVLGLVGDPVTTGLVASISRPGGNITGTGAPVAELGAKNLELAREVLPSVRLVAVLANASDPFHKSFLDHTQRAGANLGVEIKSMALRDAEMDTAFDEVKKAGADAAILQPTLPHKAAADLALKHRIPLFGPNKGISAAGALASYSSDSDLLSRHCATFVDRILKGRKPADLPVQLPTKFWLTINLKTARTLGVTVSGTMLTRADDVIE